MAFPLNNMKSFMWGEYIMRIFNASSFDHKSLFSTYYIISHHALQLKFNRKWKANSQPLEKKKHTRVA